jgi:electron transfer flavoprotein alpha/beta subunit
MEHYKPRYVSFAGLSRAFDGTGIDVLTASDLAVTAADLEANGSRTRVRRVFIHKTTKENVRITGAAANAAAEFLDRYQRSISAVIGKSIETKK